MTSLNIKVTDTYLGEVTLLFTYCFPPQPLLISKGQLLKDRIRCLLCLRATPAQGPVVQSIVSLTSSLRDHLVKYFMPLLLNTLISFVEKKREALQKLLAFFNKKYWRILDINV